ncbi:MAG: serine/threonine-protein kinase RsbW [Actinomycetota bacterium]|jgi:serine/threonine-protein kinase RsbW
MAVSATGDPSTPGTDDDGARCIQLRIPAKPEYISLCRLALTGLAEVSAMGAETIADLKLALTEAVSNSVRHAYAGRGGGQVEITYELRPDRFAIEVVDDGAGFDPDDAAAFEGDELSEGGLGIAIIRAIADEFEIRSQPGARGSRLRFVKLLA